MEFFFQAQFTAAQPGFGSGAFGDQVVFLSFFVSFLRLFPEKSCCGVLWRQTLSCLQGGGCNVTLVCVGALLGEFHNLQGCLGEWFLSTSTHIQSFPAQRITEMVDVIGGFNVVADRCVCACYGIFYILYHL